MRILRRLWCLLLGHYDLKACTYVDSSSAETFPYFWHVCLRCGRVERDS